jgi:PITH domain
VDFSAAQEYAPIQTLTVPRTNDVVELPLQRQKWNGTTSIDLFFENNYGYGDEDVTRVQYLGFKGEWTALNREAISVLYESAANPRDHKIKGVIAAPTLGQ